MNKLSHRYCALKRSLNSALKRRCVSIPFFVEKESQTSFQDVIALEKHSVPTCGNNKRCFQGLFLKGDTRLANAIPSLSTKMCADLCFHRATINTCAHLFNPLTTRADKLDWSCGSAMTAEKKDCIVIRPLLDLSRGSITAICKHEKLAVYPDKSNQSLHYSRNRIRKQIIPGIQLFLNPQVEDALFKFSELVLQEQDLVSRVIDTTSNIKAQFKGCTS